MDDKILEAFKFGTIQDCLNIQLKLDEYSISWDEFTAWVGSAGRRNEVRKIPTIPELRLKRRCPKCKAWLQLSEVNHHPKLMVGGDFKSQWFCKHCDWVEYSNQDIETVAKPYIVEE